MLDDEDRKRLHELAVAFALQLSATLDQDYPDDWAEWMGLVLGAVCEHVMGSWTPGMEVERKCFARAFNSVTGTCWALNYTDAAEAP